MNKNLKAALVGSIFFISSQAGALTVIEETIVTASRQDVPRADFSGSAHTLDRDELDRIIHVHIQQAVNRIPGVDFHRGNGQEYLPAIRSQVLSGPGACGSVLTLENGVPVRPAGFCNVNELFETHSEQAQRVEVLKGPATTFYGSNALNGLVNIIDPAPLNTGGRMIFDVGEDDFYRFRYRYGGERLAYSFTGASQRGFRDEQSNDQQKLSVRYRASGESLRATTDLTATNLNQETAGYIIGEDAYRSLSKSRENPNPEAYRDARAVRVSTRIEDDNGLQLTPYLRYSRMDFLQHFLPGTPLEENGHTSVGLQSQKQYAINPNQALTLGLDLEYADVWLKQTQDGLAEGSAFLQETVPPGKHYDFRVDSTSAALFGNFRNRFSDRVEGELGLRLEHRRYDYDNRMLDGRNRDDGTPCGFGGCRYSRPADRDDSFRDASARASINVEFSEYLRGYLALANGFRAPQITELYRLQNEQNVADLDSESLRSIELGLVHRGDGFMQELALYKMRKEDIILRNTALENVSDGKTSHLGIEWRAALTLAEQWRLAAALSYARHRYENNPGLSESDIEGNDIDSAPRKSAFVELAHEGVSGLDWGLELIYSGSYYLEAENNFKYPGHTLANLRLSMPWSERISTTLRINNLGDKRYAERADFTSFSGPRYWPGEPRTLIASLEYQF